MITASLAFIAFLFITFHISVFKGEKKIEKSLLPDDSDFTISTMPFSTERIVYYTSVPNSAITENGNFINDITVESVTKDGFDAIPMAIQVYLGQGENKKLVAELLQHRFDIPCLDSLLGENKVTKKQHEYIRKYKFGHHSTKEMLKEEVIKKLKGQNLNLLA